MLDLIYFSLHYENTSWAISTSNAHTVRVGYFFELTKKKRIFFCNLCNQVPQHMSGKQDGVIDVPVSFLNAESERMQNEPIIWLTHFFRVGAVAGAEEKLFTDLWGECCAMQYSAVKTNTQLPRCQGFRYTRWMMKWKNHYPNHTHHVEKSWMAFIHLRYGNDGVVQGVVGFMNFFVWVLGPPFGQLCGKLCTASGVEVKFLSSQAKLWVDLGCQTLWFLRVSNHWILRCGLCFRIVLWSLSPLYHSSEHVHSSHEPVLFNRLTGCDVWLQPGGVQT